MNKFRPILKHFRENYWPLIKSQQTGLLLATGLAGFMSGRCPIMGWQIMLGVTGSLFLAISTSMPELVVTFAALRLGAADMAVADILGSNMFNMAIIFPVDIFYIRESIFSAASDVHVITVAAGIVMSLLVIVGIRLRQKRKTFGIIRWYSPALILFFLAGF